MARMTDEIKRVWTADELLNLDEVELLTSAKLQLVKYLAQCTRLMAWYEKWSSSESATTQDWGQQNHKHDTMQAMRAAIEGGE